MNRSYQTTAESRVDTKERILDAAERLFAERGFSGTSLRQITKEAGVNLAAVNYHFQSKESLLQAVVLRKIGPINQRRLELLNEYTAQERFELEDVFRSFFAPLFEMERAGVDLASFPKLLARIYGEPAAISKAIFQDAFSDLVGRYTAAIFRAMPAAPPPTIGLAIHFSIGAMAHFLGAQEMLALLTRGVASRLERAEALESLIRFCSGGMRSMASQVRES